MRLKDSKLLVNVCDSLSLRLIDGVDDSEEHR